jgi:hypothetical protein
VNKIYQRIWSKIKERWILVDEKTSHGSGPAAIFGAITLAVFLSLSCSVYVQADSGALPTGGKITSGKGSISSVGSQMTVKQNTQQKITNWGTFNIGVNAGVTFKQPNSNAAALNRIHDQSPSIVSGQGAQINGPVAPSLNVPDSDFLTGKYTFLNEGTITARSSDGLMASGDQVTLDFNGDGLISYTINKGEVDALAENKGLIKADGGMVVMTAEAAKNLTSAVVNTSGVIEADTLENKNGRIILMSDMESGATKVSGKPDTSAPNGGDGGFIETFGIRR